MRKKLKYILSEAKCILFCAVLGAMMVTWISVGYWWFKPQALVLAIVGGSFTITLLLGIFASLHDDYKLSVKIERREHRK